MCRLYILATTFSLVCVPSHLRAEEDNPQRLAEKARAILLNACYRCHGEKGAVEGGFNYVLDRGQLVARKRLIPGNPDKSKLIKRIVSGDMPPEQEKPRPSAEDVSVLRA